jgi:hypothetical protein
MSLQGLEGPPMASLEWTAGEDCRHRMVHPSGTWTIEERPASPSGHGFDFQATAALFFRPEGSESDSFPAVETYGCSHPHVSTIGFEVGYFRSAAEARIATALMLNPPESVPAIEASMQAGDYKQTYADTDDHRFGWSRHYPEFGGGRITFHVGSDDDRECVFVEQSRGGSLLTFAYLTRHDDATSRPACASDFATDIWVVSTLARLVEESGHVREPLTDADWREWSAGRPIPVLWRPRDAGAPVGSMSLALLQREMLGLEGENLFATNRLFSEAQDGTSLRRHWQLLRRRQFS